MKTVFIAFVLSVSCFAPALAQTTSAPTPPMSQAPTGQGQPDAQPATPSNAPAQGDTMTAPSNTATADLTGQAIYTQKDHKIGTVSAMTTDSRGQQAASVTIEKYLGMGGQSVAIPVSSLNARANGGYTTNLSSAELKSLAKSGASGGQ